MPPVLGLTEGPGDAVAIPVKRAAQCKFAISPEKSQPEVS